MFKSLAPTMIAMLLFSSIVKECSGQATYEAQLRSRIERALPLLEKASAGSADHRQCFTCHSQAIPVFVFVEARQRGFQVNGDNLARQVEHAHAHLERGLENYLEGKAPGGGIDTAGYALWTIEDGGREPNKVTDAVIGWILKSQTSRGNWKPSSERPPTQGSLFTSTYLALRALNVFGQPSDKTLLDDSKSRATKWLFDAEPKSHEDRVFQLLSTQYANVSDEQMEKMIAAVKSSQHSDGGWSQLDSMSSDAYATSTALYALYRAGISSTDEAWTRGVQYLLNTQLDDGSWHVVTRSKPIQTYFETGFPHEKDQFISSYATAWSTLVLLYSLPNSAIWRIETIAGTGVKGFSGDGGLATQAQLDNPFGVVRGPDGAIWFCEYSGQRVRRIAPDGTISTIAGNGKSGYSGDGGPALQATFNLPHEIRFDQAGDLYAVDMNNHAIRKVDLKTGIISTIAGTGSPGYSGDGGPAAHAQFRNPHSIQFGPDGNLYVCDIGNHVIRCIDMKSHVVTTIAGTGKPGNTPDGAPIANTPLRGPRSIDFDIQGNLWLATREGNQVFKLDLKSKTIHHIAGTGEKGFAGNGGPAKLAKLNGPKGIAVDASGNIWLADTESHTVRMVESSTGNLLLIAGTGESGDGPDGDPLKCKLARLHGIFVDRDGSVLIGDSEAHRIRVLRNK